MAQFYVELCVWVDAEDEDDARAQVTAALNQTDVTTSYDILNVEADHA